MQLEGIHHITAVTGNASHNVAFYTQVLGLGASPDDVTIIGNVHADPTLSNNNATQTFWRAAEGFSVNPSTGTLQWAVSPCGCRRFSNARAAFRAARPR